MGAACPAVSPAAWRGAPGALRGAGARQDAAGGQMLGAPPGVGAAAGGEGGRPHA